jgi:sec-independent protein translocase protein TatB
MRSWRFGTTCRVNSANSAELLCCLRHAQAPQTIFKIVKTVSPTRCRYSIPGSMMNRMSFSETIFLFFLALIIFGPKKLPEIARQIGKALNEFRRASNEFKAQIEQEISNLEVDEIRKKQQANLTASSAPEGTASRTLSTGGSASSSADANATQPNPAESNPQVEPVTLAASAEEPQAATSIVEPATEALAPADHPDSDSTSTSSSISSPASALHETEPVTSSTTQESHA